MAGTSQQSKILVQQNSIQSGPTKQRISIPEKEKAKSKWTTAEISLQCNDADQDTNYKKCQCKKYNVSYSDGQAPSNVQAFLGTYEKVVNDYVTTYKEESKKLYLFSIHPLGRVWTIGPGLTIDKKSLAFIDFEKYGPDMCPHYGTNNGLHWQLVDNDKSDSKITVNCFECQENFVLDDALNCVEKENQDFETSKLNRYINLILRIQI